MDNIVIDTLTPDVLPQVMELQQAYERQFPGVAVIPGGLYLSPAFHEGQDVFCAFVHEPVGRRLVAYAPVYVHIVEDGPAALPHQAWTEVKAHPDLSDSQHLPDSQHLVDAENLAAERVKDLLLERVLQRARERIAPFPGRAAELLFEYRPYETPAIAYVLARGFVYQKSAFFMRRDLSAPVPSFAVPEGIAIRCWKMESEAEQRAYVTARNEVFPDMPITLAEWQYYLTSPQWAAGTMIAAFNGAELVGAVSVYWNEEENQRSGQKMGFTEDIFVRSAWRGKGIARAAITAGMDYLKEHGLAEACLQVSALNENALGLYLGLGYQVVQESRHYAKSI